MLLISNNCIQAWHAKFTKQEQNCLSRTVMNEADFFKLFELKDKIDFSKAAFSVADFNDPELATSKQMEDRIRYVVAEIDGMKFWLTHPLEADLEKDVDAQRVQWMRRVERNPDFAKNALYVFGDQCETYSAKVALQILECRLNELKTKRLVYITRFKTVYNTAGKIGAPNVVFERSSQLRDAAKRLKNIGIR